MLEFHRFMAVLCRVHVNVFFLFLRLLFHIHIRALWRQHNYERYDLWRLPVKKCTDKTARAIRFTQFDFQSGDILEYSDSGRQRRRQ